MNYFPSPQLPSRSSHHHLSPGSLQGLPKWSLCFCPCLVRSTHHSSTGCLYLVCAIPQLSGSMRKAKLIQRCGLLFVLSPFSFPLSDFAPATQPSLLSPECVTHAPTLGSLFSLFQWTWNTLLPNKVGPLLNFYIHRCRNTFTGSAFTDSTNCMSKKKFQKAPKSKFEFASDQQHFAEKARATHASTLAWKIPWMEEPGRLQSIGSLRVGHD